MFSRIARIGFARIGFVGVCGIVGSAAEFAPRNSRILTKIRKFAALGSDLGVHDRYSATYSA
jgi:hypothetical protein